VDLTPAITTVADGWNELTVTTPQPLQFLRFLCAPQGICEAAEFEFYARAP
jgi:hypothetical protein